MVIFLKFILLILNPLRLNQGFGFSTRIDTRKEKQIKKREGNDK